MTRDDAPFWKRVPLEEMTPEQWESLCDGCAKCCLHKLVDADTDDLYFTNVACRLLDQDNCRCSDYPRRNLRVPDCMILTPDNVDQLTWMPSTCAYRLISQGEDLPDWHPLVSGDPDSVHRAGVSVRGRCINEDDAGPIEDHILDEEP